MGVGDWSLFGCRGNTPVNWEVTGILDHVQVASYQSRPSELLDPLPFETCLRNRTPGRHIGRSACVSDWPCVPFTGVAVFPTT